MKIHWNRKSYTEEQFRAAWAEATSINDVARRLNLRVSGGSSTTLRTLGEALGLNTGHFQPGGPTRRRPLEEILVKHSPIHSNSGLRQRLVKAGLKEDKCEHCGITEWMGQPAPLQLDHENGDNRDNRLENLRVLCANCHMLTDTWCGKNKVRRTGITRELPKAPVSNYCPCGTEILPASTLCGSCERDARRERAQKADPYPSTFEMLIGVSIMGYLPYAKTLGVSDNTVRKILRRRGVTTLPAGKNQRPKVVA